MAWFDDYLRDCRCTDGGPVRFLDQLGVTVLISKVKAWLRLKQDVLVAGQNIKTVNGESILGAGDITVTSQVVSRITEEQIDEAFKATFG